VREVEGGSEDEVIDELREARLMMTLRKRGERAIRKTPEPASVIC